MIGAAGCGRSTGSLTTRPGSYPGGVLDLVRRLAVPIALTSLVVNGVMLVVSCLLWWLAWEKHWLGEVTFVAHVSMLALVFAAVSGVAAGLAGLLALMPVDETLSSATTDSVEN